MALTSGDVARRQAPGRGGARPSPRARRRLGHRLFAAHVRLCRRPGGDWPRAQELYGESAQRFRVFGDEHYELRAARAHAWSFYEDGNLDHARELYEDVCHRAHATHNELVEAVALSVLAEIAADEGRVVQAVSMMEESQRIVRELNNLLLIAAVVGSFALLLAVARRATLATQVLSTSNALMEEIGARPPWSREDKQEDPRRRPQPARQRRLRHGLGARSDIDGRRGRSARPRLARSRQRLSRIRATNPQALTCD